MIESIELENFRSHKKMKIEFDPGVTAIVGDSNSGKTNILRGFSWLSTNKPKGLRFLNRKVDEKAEVKVKVSLMEGGIVSLKKSKNKKAVYKIDDGEDLKGFGQNVPKEVDDKLCISDLNFQKQFDKPFLVGSTGGEIVRAINKIIRLEEVYKWVSSINKKICKVDGEISATEKRLDEIEHEIGSLEYLQKMKSHIERGEKYQKQIEKYGKDISEIVILTTDSKQISIEVVLLNDLVLKVDKHIKVASDLNQKIIKMDEEEELLDLYFVLNGELNQISKGLGAEKEINKAEVLLDKINDSAVEINDLKNISDIMKGITDEMANLEDSLLMISQEYKAMLNEYKKCPIFGKDCQYLKDDKTRAIILREV